MRGVLVGVDLFPLQFHVGVELVVGEHVALLRNALSAASAPSASRSEPQTVGACSGCEGVQRLAVLADAADIVERGVRQVDIGIGTAVLDAVHHDLAERDRIAVAFVGAIGVPGARSAAT